MQTHTEPNLPQTAPWRPLLDGELAERARATVEAIAHALLQPEHQSEAPANLAGGGAGIALFYAYLAQAQPGRGWEDKALALVDRAVEALGEGVQWHSLYSGFTGTAWAVQHLQGRLLDAGGEDPNAEIDEVLLQFLSRSPWREDYDLIIGLVGHGLYGLSRVHTPSGRALLSKVLDRLEETKVAMDGGWTWKTAPELLPEWQRELNPQGYYNLGLAHGVPGVIALLGQVCAAGIDADRARPMLDGAVRWLLAQKHSETAACCFNTVVPVGDEKSEERASRIAWCYGDLGLAIALLWAARAVGQADWEQEALAVARKCALRPLEQGGCMDAGLCHGAAGNGHLFNRLYQATGEEVFADAARAWFQQAFVYRRPEEGIDGWQAYHPRPEEPDHMPWVTEAGFLEGAAGIAMAFLAALGGPTPDWDAMLLVSLPPRA